MHDVVQQAYPFTHTAREQISSGVSKLVDLYTKCVTRDDRSQAERQLRVHQREQIAWERDTVWRQMISQARRGEQDGQLKALEHEASPAVGTNVLLSIETGVGAIKLKRKHISLALAVAVFAILLQASVLDTVEASNCFAILTFSTILWATEVSYS
jgi:phosphate transporter